MEKSSQKYVGYATIVGRPNVGKSTLLNALLERKISITARKPQTTRHRITGIQTIDNVQTIFLDTPGLHQKHHRQLNKHMNRAAWSTINDVNVILFLIDANAWHKEDEWILERLKTSTVPIVLILNKIDKLQNRDTLLPFIETLNAKHDFVCIIPISAKNMDNLEALPKVIAPYLQAVDEFLYDKEEVTDRSQRFMLSEILREKIIRHLGQEVPYSTTVGIEAFEIKNNKAFIHALILVEKPGQKSIVIGNKGEVLKKIATLARKDMEDLLDQQVVLKVWVKVKENWSDNENIVLSLVYKDE